MRDQSVSMTKGVAILLMVLVHGRFSHYGDVYINMFHMPLFFFVSGYCFKESYLNDFRGYLWKRIKGAYWPFVKWGLLFLILHNVFFTLNIYNGEYGFRGGVSVLYSTKDFLQRAFQIVTSMNGAEQLLGGYWFLHSYFAAAIISFFTIWIFRKKMSLIVIGGGILLIISVLLKKYNFSIPYYVSAREFLASFFMVFGYYYKQSGWKIENRPLLTIIGGAVIVACGASFWPTAMNKLEWQKVIPYAFSALAGTLMVFSLCKWLCEKKLEVTINTLTYVGDHTMEILTWHFLSFKLVSLIIIAIYVLPIARLAEFPVIEEYAYQGWWILYFIIGAGVSLAIALIIEVIEGLIKKSFNHFIHII